MLWGLQCLWMGHIQAIDKFRKSFKWDLELLRALLTTDPTVRGTELSSDAGWMEMSVILYAAVYMKYWMGSMRNFLEEMEIPAVWDGLRRFVKGI